MYAPCNLCPVSIVGYLELFVHRVGGQTNRVQLVMGPLGRDAMPRCPKAWNQLPTSVRHITFKRHLKTILFAEAYSVSP